MTAILKNWFGLTTLGTATLTSHTSPTEIRLVVPGKNRAVMYYDFKEWEKYEDGLGEVIFTNVKTGEKLNKAYYFASPIYEYINESVYEKDCKLVDIGEDLPQQECTETLTGYRISKRLVRWEKLNGKDIPKGNNRIALITNVGYYDKIDAVWTIAGKKISKHAEWGSSLDAGNVNYYRFEKTSGLVLDFRGANNLTANGGVTRGVSGQIDNAFEYDGGDDNVNGTSGIAGDTSITVCGWYNISSIAADRAVFTVNSDGGGSASGFAASGHGAKMELVLEGVSWGSTGPNVAINTWHHLCLTRDGTQYDLYQDGDSSPISSLTNAGGTFSGAMTIGARSSSGLTQSMLGIIDEVGVWNRVLNATEILFLNSSISPPIIIPIVTIIFPENIIYNTTITELNYTVDASGVRCWFSIDGGATNSSDNDCTANFTTTSVAGGNTWTVYSNNSDGRVGQDSVTFTVESGMNINLISPVNNTFTSDPVINFSCNATDNFQLVNLTLVLDGAENETNTTVGTSMTLTPSLNLTQGQHNWTCRAVDNESFVLTEPIRIFEIGITAPTLNILFPDVTIPLHQLGTNLTLNWSITEPGRNLTEHIISCNYMYNAIRVSLNTTACISINETSFLYVKGVNNISMGVTDLFNNTANDTTLFDVLILEDTAFFNSSSFETKSEKFTLSLTSNGTTPTNGRFIYNGTIQTATITSTGGNDFNLSRTIDIPLRDGNKTFFFSTVINGVEVNTSSRTQNVTAVNLAFCNSTLNTPYINFTFHNETTNEEDVTAFIDSSWVYFIGSGVVNKTLNYANTTEDFKYTFCFGPGNQTISSTLTMSYNNAQSQQRVFNPTLLTLSNLTATQKLFLLPTTLGLFSQFKTEDTIGNTLTLVKAVITRVLGGSTITITSGFTDGSGIIVLFLNPDVTYTGTFTKSGFTDNIFTFVPIIDLRTVVMGSTTVVPVIGSNISIGTNYEIQPNNDSLNNNTLVTFSFNVTSDQDITLISMNITNSTHQISFQSNAGDGFISDIINTRNNTKLFGEFIIQTGSETITVMRVWNIGRTFIGDYSLFKQLSLFTDYNFNDFYKFLIVLVAVMGLLIFMSGDQQAEDELKMAAVAALIWGFSIVGWLDTGIVISSSSGQVNTLAQFSNQYGLAILTTVAASYFILRRVFRQI